jgi:hypothetical protein
MNASDRLKSAIGKLTQMIAKLETPTVPSVFKTPTVIAVPNVPSVFKIPTVVAVPNVPSVFKIPTVIAVPKVFTNPRDPDKFDNP